MELLYFSVYTANERMNLANVVVRFHPSASARRAEAKGVDGASAAVTYLASSVYTVPFMQIFRPHASQLRQLGVRVTAVYSCQCIMFSPFRPVSAAFAPRASEREIPSVDRSPHHLFHLKYGRALRIAFRRNCLENLLACGRSVVRRLYRGRSRSARRRWLRTRSHAELKRLKFMSIVCSRAREKKGRSAAAKRKTN